MAFGTSILLNAIGAFVFWVLVARLTTADRAGEAQALFQAAVVITYAGSLGLPILVARFARPASTDLANWAMGVRLISAVAFTFVFLAVVGRADAIAPLWQPGRFAGTVLFVLVAAGMATAVLVEVRLTTLRRWGWVVGRSVTAALLRLPLLVLVAADVVSDDGMPLLIFLIAAGPVAVSGFAVALWLRLGVDRTANLLPHRPDGTIEMVRYSALNWLSLAATQGPVLAIPLVVALSVDGATNSPFYIAWSVGAVMFLVPQMIGQVTLSESAEGDHRTKLFHGLRLSLAITTAATVASAIGARAFTRLLGEGYGELASYLPILVAASVAWSFTSLGLTAIRLGGRQSVLVWLSMGFVIATMAPTLLLIDDHGAGAVAWSWLGGNLIIAVATGIVHAVRPLDGPGPDPDPAAGPLSVPFTRP